MRHDQKPVAPSLNPLPVLRTYWTLSGEGHTATAVLVKHPLGVELRILDGDELRRSQVHRGAADAERDAFETRERLRARGWQDR